MKITGLKLTEKAGTGGSTTITAEFTLNKVKFQFSFIRSAVFGNCGVKQLTNYCFISDISQPNFKNNYCKECANAAREASKFIAKGGKQVTDLVDKIREKYQTRYVWTASLSSPKCAYKRGTKNSRLDWYLIDLMFRDAEKIYFPNMHYSERHSCIMYTLIPKSGKTQMETKKWKEQMELEKAN